ncbi:hypothetical protein ACFLSQ_06325 [Bacteroidota bacterium]
MMRTLYILTLLFFTQAGNQFLFSTITPDVEAVYDCRNVEIDFTIVKDTDNDGVYDTYVVRWCNETIDTYPICAIGDIRRWPPTGIPTRDIVQTNQEQKIFIELYNGIGVQNLLCWFIKPEGIDTVYYYDNRFEMQFMTDVDEYSSPNISFKTTPNPANNYIELAYSIEKNGWVTISLYNEIGIIVDIIDESYKYSGDYNMIYRLDKVPSGKYFLTVKLGIDEIFTRQIVIIK